MSDFCAGPAKYPVQLSKYLKEIYFTLVTDPRVVGI